jgi:hypothetical protein
MNIASVPVFKLSIVAPCSKWEHGYAKAVPDLGMNAEKPRKLSAWRTWMAFRVTLSRGMPTPKKREYGVNAP